MTHAQKPKTTYWGSINLTKTCFANYIIPAYYVDHFQEGVVHPGQTKPLAIVLSLPDCKKVKQQTQLNVEIFTYFCPVHTS